MPPFIADMIWKVRSILKDMLYNVLMIYGEKGTEPFRRPLIIAGTTLLVIYALVYSPAGRRLESASNRLESMRTVAQYAAVYEDGKARLAAYQRKLPLLKDKDEWLNYIITNSARAYGISFDGISGQKEIEVGNFMVVSREVTVTTTYAKLGKWLAEIENSPIFLRVVDLNVRRDPSAPGIVKVSFRLSTILPRFAGGGG